MKEELANKQRWVEPEPQEPPASVDFIRSLPDEMLVTIISLLPIKSGVRIIVLSRRWRPFWHSTTLDLIDKDELYSKECKRLDTLSHILAMHPGPVRRLAIGKFRSNCKAEPRFHDWFLSPALGRLDELSFHAGHPRSLPPSVLRLEPTLRRTMFTQCLFPQIDAALIRLQLNTSQALPKRYCLHYFKAWTIDTNSKSWGG
ncbi:putative F-box/FBD/LRR-repeat protein At5g52460 [Aegilops tauschii subsp. strangulata]|uniref:putative F-box/FBD/LRR-repeat protein At5g52460 n=1 Tax=Aegilops tauschii subsp. strangulata TaxID=200361 RepID=UPI00098AF2AB|nr:putative F-box/FBD/LRR-repeat protein At5g52460 [Aegilops tauschii subsp. strangulata]